MRRVLALSGVAALLGLGAACSTLSTLHGARTLEPGQVQAGVGLTLQRGANPLSNAGLPLPQAEVAVRVGVSPDVDVGARLYLLGTGFDVRYRFFQQDRLHLAVAPGLSGFWLPISDLARQGSVEVVAPLVAEYALKPWLAVSAGPRVVLRDQFNGIKDETLGKGRTSRLDAFTGGGARLEVHTGRLVLGLAGAALAQPARRGGLAWSAGLDIGLRPRRAPKDVKPPAP